MFVTQHVIVRASWKIILTGIISSHSSELSWEGCNFFSKIWSEPSLLPQFRVRCSLSRIPQQQAFIIFATHSMHWVIISVLLFYLPHRILSFLRLGLHVIHNFWHRFSNYLLEEKHSWPLLTTESKRTPHFSTPAYHHHEKCPKWGEESWSSLHLTATCTHTCIYSNPTLRQAEHSHPAACLVTKHFLNQFAPSFCNILQQIKHPLLGMFSICFMLILIKESETEQTVPSRWPYKCEISKLFYLPQTLLVNFFKLIPASKTLLISRRKLSNPSLQIFAFLTAPGANWWYPPLFVSPSPICSPDPSLALHWPNPSTQNKDHVPTWAP